MSPRSRCPGRSCARAGHQVVFATEQAGTRPAGDPRLLTGVLLGQLGAAPAARAAYAQLTGAAAFAATLGWADLTWPGSTGCCCPAATRRECASTSARRCCGTRSRGSGRSAARSARSATACWCWRAPATRRPGPSVLAGRRTTCLPKYMERGAYLLTAWQLGRYYRTYPAYVRTRWRRRSTTRRSSSAGPRALRPRHRGRRPPGLRRRRTAATSRPAGPATPTCSAASSAISSRPAGPQRVRRKGRAGRAIKYVAEQAGRHDKVPAVLNALVNPQGQEVSG